MKIIKNADLFKISVFYLYTTNIDINTLLQIGFFQQKMIFSICPSQKINYLCTRKSPDGGIGRRAGLKHQWIHFHAGSIPALGTVNPNKNPHNQ
jgi:hypothetical protein